MAVSAVDVALWDLKARLLGRPLHRLLGAVRDSVPVYGSGGFTTYDDERTAAQLEGWLADGVGAVKIKIGESWGTRVDRDLHRVGLARRVAGDDIGVFVDANGGYRAGQAIRVGRGLATLGVSWFEEPVTSDDPAGLARVRDALDCDVTAGEYCWTVDDVVRLVEAVDCIQLDATRCGGYTGWFRCAAVAAAHHLEVSAHCAPYLHLPVSAATPHLRHIEWFHDHVRIEQRLLSPAGLVDGALVPTDAPGHSWVPSFDALASHRVA
jgi:L-alanine-DL-glutamate epimerase-like enolase superfamily enzyme